MKSAERESPNEYETMDTLALLRLYHKATVQLNSISFNDVPSHKPETDTDVRTFEKGKMASVEGVWEKQRRIMDETRKTLETRGTKFTNNDIDITSSSKEIQDLVANNGPE